MAGLHFANFNILFSAAGAGVPEMNRQTLCFCIAAGIGVAVFAAAFAVAPHSCEGGLEIYFWIGAAALGALVALPLVVLAGSSVPARLAWVLGFAAFGIAAWLAGAFAANVRILCRLF
ncbi:MAG: hypothetical protein ABI624_07785 [Casimicrobiaceae bacterium]